MALLIDYKLKASMMLEALIATIVVAISFGLAVSVYSNVLRSGDLRNKLKAQLILNNHAIEMKTEKKYVDDKIEYDNGSLIQKISKYNGTGNVFQLSLTFTDKSGKVLAAQTELIVE